MDYYISRNDGKYYGPFPKDQLIANGLDLNTMVWREGLPAWTQANMLPELSDIIGDVPPPMEMTIQPSKEVQQPATSQSHNTEAEMQQHLEQLNRKKAELKAKLELKKAQGQAKVAQARAQQIAEHKTKIESEQKAQKETEKQAKKKTTLKSKTKTKTKYDHPVATWHQEAMWLLAFVVIHALMALLGWTTFSYLYLDILGAALSITGIATGIQIKNLNNISYKKNSPQRLKAEKLSTFNGYLVSATAAAGFIIILIQSAHYIYIC